MNRRKDTIGALAAGLFALISAIACAYHVSVLTDLLRDGVRTSAVVVDFERGARNSRWAVYRYAGPSGEPITARDLFLEYIRGVERGENIFVLYDPESPDRVTADLGVWNWQAPAIYGVGFVLLAGLTLAVWIHRSAEE